MEGLLGGFDVGSPNEVSDRGILFFTTCGTNLVLHAGCNSYVFILENGLDVLLLSYF